LVSGENVKVVINQNQEINKILPFAKIVLPITVYNNDGNATNGVDATYYQYIGAGLTGADVDSINFEKNINISYCDKLIRGINYFSSMVESFFVFGAGEMSSIILPYTNAIGKVSYFIDDYNSGVNVVNTEKSFEIIKESNCFIDILVMVNPAHSEIIKRKYQDFKNVNLIFLSGSSNELA
jgi:hypothetical protein